MRSPKEITEELVEREMEALTMKFAALISMIPVEERHMLVHQMIGAGAAMIAAGVASSSNRATARKDLDSNLFELIDSCIQLHTLATHQASGAMQ